jgi:quinol monooxygenase YgiN
LIDQINTHQIAVVVEAWQAATLTAGGSPRKQGGAMPYTYMGSMKARPGHRDDVVAILLSGIHSLPAEGCSSYVVSVSDTDEDTIWVFEIWQTKGHHDASLQLPEVKEAMSKAMPMLTGEFTSQELTVVGGLGR